MTISPEKRRLPRWLWLNWNERRRQFRREGWVLLATLYFLMVFAYLLSPDFRNTSTLYVLFAWAAQIIRTLQFHLGLLALLVAHFALLARRWRMVFAASPMLLFIFTPTLLACLPRSHPSAVLGNKPLRLFSANLLMINHNTAGIMDEISAADPDVFLLQEFTDHWQKAIDARFAQRYPNRVCVPQEDSFGTAIYSKVPFVGKTVDNLHMGDWPLAQLRVVIPHQGRDIALYNIHLVPPRNLEYTAQHRQEFADLLDLMSAESLPVIMTGDLNCTENTSQAYALQRGGFSDAHELAGFGRGSTWPVNSFLRYLPGLRFDHIYLSGQLTAISCRTGVGQGSDHRPVIADICFKE